MKLIKTLVLVALLSVMHEKVVRADDDDDRADDDENEDSFVKIDGPYGKGGKGSPFEKFRV